MRVVEFLRLLDDGIRMRVRFVIESGAVVQFTVQLEWLSGGRWIGLVRYDTAHGFAHCDTMHPYEPASKMRLPMQSYGDALTFAIDDLTANWRRYRRRYTEWQNRN